MKFVLFCTYSCIPFKLGRKKSYLHKLRRCLNNLYCTRRYSYQACLCTGHSCRTPRDSPHTRQCQRSPSCRRRGNQSDKHRCTTLPAPDSRCLPDTDWGRRTLLCLKSALWVTELIYSLNPIIFVALIVHSYKYMGQNFERCTIGSRHGVKLKFQKC